MAILASALAGASMVGLIWGLRSLEANLSDSFTILEAKRPWPADAEFLAESEALQIAEHAMTAAGYSTAAWRPLNDDRSRAPDGRLDEYLVRNTIEQSSGTIMFRNPSRKDWYRDLFVTFERKGDELHVVVHRGK